MNSTFVKDVQSDESLEAFSNYFTKFDELHDYLTAHSSRNCVTMEHSRTQFIVLSPSGTRQLPYGIF